MAVSPSVSVPTMPSVSHSVMRPKRRRPALSSCPNCAMADDGASTPVASAIATGKASRIATNVACPGAVDAGA